MRKKTMKEIETQRFRAYNNQTRLQIDQTGNKDSIDERMKSFLKNPSINKA